MKSKESKNKFKCASCGEQRLRGLQVYILKGEHKGMSVKTCQAEECVKAAEAGRFGEVLR